MPNTTAMTQPYDLCLTLTPPLAGAPAGTIANVELRCDELGFHQPIVLPPLADPFTPAERDELTWYLETYWQWPYEEFARRGQRVEQLLTEAGQRLYQAVFGSAQAKDVIVPWRLQPDVQRQLSIISNAPPALRLPWELLCDEQGFLALRTKNPVSIIRRLPQSELGALPTAFTPPLRVLLVTARPDDAGFVDPRGIARELLDEAQPQIEAGAIALEFLRPPTRPALRERLSQSPLIHILHFDGHGTFGETPVPGDGQRLHGAAQGKLAFEKDDGSLDLAPADELAQLLQDSGVRLAVLTACQSAKGASDDLFSSVAARLIRSGVDAVIAMSASVLVASAAKYVEAFYRRLAAGEAVTLAHERARQALHDNPERHLHQRRRDEAGTPIKLKDWWLPHFYQQRALTFGVSPSGGKDSTPKPIPPEGGTPNASADLPPAPRYGFTGRARELHQIERWLLRGSAVVVHGFGGAGKTAIAREAADWLTRTGMYTAACFVSFEHGGDAATLLSALANRLGVNTGDYDPRNVGAALATLRRQVRSPGFSRNPGNASLAPEGGTTNSVLIIADNLESILPGGDAPLDAATRAQLWDVLLQLSAAGAGVIVTSRNAEFGDGRMAHGKEVKHLELGGLHPEDAYALAVQLFKDLDIAQSRAPYRKLRDLLDQLGRHPLAIQLVLTALRDDPQLTLDRLSADFAALLPRFTDDRESGRNRSLLASLEYSLRRLGDEERQLLALLAPFECGASEDDLLAITEIAERDWLRLRPALERAALLTPEQVGDFEAPFLRFHPVLAPYLRTQAGPSGTEEDAALRSRYAARYHAVANYLYHEDRRNPQAVRELARRELPNLRRALEWLLDSGALDQTAEMEAYIARFLNCFGLWRERDELRRRVDQAVAAAGQRTGGELTWAEYLRESGVGEDEFARGNLRAAFARFTSLREQIEALPSGAPLGPGSDYHYLTLHWLARCLGAGGQLGAAETLLRRALEVIQALLAAQPENQDYIGQCGVALADLGDMLREQGSYAASQAALEASLKIKEPLGDMRGQGVALVQLGTLALKQRDYAAARQRYRNALRLFQTLDEPMEVALILHRLGLVAQEQSDWAEAEPWYRASLEIRERHGDAEGVADSCCVLGIVAENSGRPAEAEGWYKRALNASDLPLSKVAMYSNNLALLLKDAVREGRMPAARLAEARDYAERALEIKETLDASSEIWTTQGILADIAELEGDTQAARNFRRRERVSFAAFAGNRWNIDNVVGKLLPVLAAAAKGDEDARATVETVLPQLEAIGLDIRAAIPGLYAGKRDWHALAEDLNWWQALLVLRVLETLEEMKKE